MFKRVTWLGVGFTIGVGTTVVAARKARQQLDRYKPNAVAVRVTDNITDRASSFRDQVAAALDDGKRAARDREQELRARRPGRVPELLPPDALSPDPMPPDPFVD